MNDPPHPPPASGPECAAPGFGPASAGPGAIGGHAAPILTGHAAPISTEIAAIEFDAEAIAAAVRRLADRIFLDYAGEPVLLIGVLKGALFFIADLARALPAEMDISIDFLVVSSYGNADRTSGEVRLLKDTSLSVEGKNVVIVEDIVDNGLTLAYLERLLASRNPASLRSCVLLDKPYRRQVDVRIDYVGLVAPDAFIVGYGLDYQEKYRQLPYLARLHAWVFEG
jgi:hypoxanthine phosphoribosyltransferase